MVPAPSYARGLRCRKCSRTFPKEYRLDCPDCQGLLQIEYDLETLRATGPAALQGTGVWRYAPLLPIAHPAHRVSLGEQATPLLPCPRLGAELGLERLHLKFEGTLPTGSVKDRSSATAVAAAQEFGYAATAVVSTGNAGSSLAAYSTRAGLKSFIFCYEKGAVPKMHHIAGCATQLIVYRGGYDDLIRIYDAVLEQSSTVFECGGSRNAYKQEGKKTIAYEVIEQLGGQAPDVFVALVAVGECFLAAWRGFNEWFRLGWGNQVPRMICAQSARANPIVIAAREGGPLVPQRIGYTVAEGAAVGNPMAKGEWVLDLLREYDGGVADAADDEVLAAQQLLARTEGIWAGPSGCVGLAALAQLVREKQIPGDALVVCLITETGLKGEYPPFPTDPITPTRETVERILHF